jgi:hypothetical protein
VPEVSLAVEDFYHAPARTGTFDLKRRPTTRLHAALTIQGKRLEFN